MSGFKLVVQGGRYCIKGATLLKRQTRRKLFLGKSSFLGATSLTCKDYVDSVLHHFRDYR